MSSQATLLSATSLLTDGSNVNIFSDISSGKESTCNAGDPALIPESGRATGEGIGYPLQYSGLNNSMGCIVLGVTKSPTRVSHFHYVCITHMMPLGSILQRNMFTFHLNLCILLLAQQYFPSNCSFPACGTGFCFLDLILVSLPLFIRSLKWQPTPVLLPGKFHGLRSLIGCSPWGHKESDTTELLHFYFP